jgi:FkbM family methyltransferase
MRRIVRRGRALPCAVRGMSVAGSVAVRLAYKAIAAGVRLPRVQRLYDFDQQSRTLDAMRRCGIDVVLDVGANRGFYAKHLRMMGFTGRILSFEPDPGTFRHLVAMAEGDPRWQVFNIALGEAAGEIDFHVVTTGEQTTLSSALRPLDGFDRTTIRVPVRPLTEVLREADVPDDARVFLKMDTQGYDLKVFEGAGNAPAIRLMQSEVSVVPIYDGMPHYTDALRRYEEAGFMLLDLFVVNRTEEGGVLEYDALMMRDRRTDGDETGGRRYRAPRGRG